MHASFSIPPGLAYGSGEVVPDIQPGLDVLDAAYHTVHSYPGGVAALAVRMGVPVTTLTHKVNVNNTTHHLSLREAVAVQHFSGNAAILQAMAEALGYVCVRATPAAMGEPVQQLAEMASEFADTLRAGSDAVALGQGRVTPNAMRRYDHYAAQLQSAINALAGTLRGMMPRQTEGGGK